MSKNKKKYKFKRAPLTQKAWQQFRVNLAVALADLGEDEFLVIIAKSTAYFVQFAGQGASGMRAEATSNTYITEKEARLSKEARKHLLALGWNAPTYVPSEGIAEPSDGSPNYYVDVAVPVPYATLASLAVETLRDIYGVRSPGELMYSAYSDQQNSIRFPLLAIMRAE